MYGCACYLMNNLYKKKKIIILFIFEILSFNERFVKRVDFSWYFNIKKKYLHTCNLVLRDIKTEQDEKYFHYTIVSYVSIIIYIF